MKQLLMQFLINIYYVLGTQICTMVIREKMYHIYC